MLVHQVTTTEKVPFTYRVAGMGSRFLAWLIDLLVIVLIQLAGLWTGMVLDIGRAGLGMAVIFMWQFVAMWGYFALFEWLWHGQTPGKWLLGIRVIQWQGTSISFFQALGRNLVRVVDGLPFLFLGGLLPGVVGFGVAASNRFQRRLGDFAAGTLVVHVDRKAGPIRVLHEGALEAAATSEAVIRQRLGQLGREQKQTLLDLCLRREQLRITDRAQLFRAVADFCKQQLDLAPAEHESDEKFVVGLAAVLGASLTGRSA
jgi:uncharacterized RDD family membrane protein YckC